MTVPGPTRRRHLVVVRAGDRSLHERWIEPGGERTFDLIVSYYGSDPQRFRDGPHPRIDDAGDKYPGLKRLLERERRWRDYEWIWLPDDDLATTQDQIERLFDRVRSLDLDLAQPALGWSSHVNYAPTLCMPSLCARYTNFVEIMAPCFRVDALERCLPTFDANRTGWGLSFVWPRLLGTGLRRCAIVDDAVVTHTRPAGGPAYARLPGGTRDAAVERAAVMTRYGLSPHTDVRVYAAADGTGRFLDAGIPDDASRLMRLLADDTDAVTAWRDAHPADGVPGRDPAYAWRRWLPAETLRALAGRVPRGREARAG